MELITSRQNKLIKQIASLHKAKNRKQFNQCIAEGIRTCSTLLNGNTQLIHLFVTERCKNTALELAVPEKTILVADSVMELLSTQKNPPGLLGVFEIPKNDLSIVNTDKSIVLADITDPGNMGTLIRTAAAFGFNKVICVEGTDPWSPKVIHATAGTIAHVTIARHSWKSLLQEKKDFTLAALVVSDGKPLESISTKKHILVVGNEAHGIKAEWFQTCQERVTIAMPGGTESLNASVAGAIAMYTLSK